MENTSRLSRFASRVTYRKDSGDTAMASRPRITLIGTGYVGTALGLGLTKVRGSQNNFEILAHDRSAPASSAAKKRGAVDRTDWNLISSVEDADLIFLAIPVLAIKETLNLIGGHLKAGAIVTDTGGTKSQVMQWAKESLPATVNFIGGDPILGREGAPADTATAEVLVKAMYCLAPSPNADPDSIRILSDFVAGMGAQPYFIDPDEHDGIVAGAAHLPFLLSIAMLNTAARSPSWPEFQKMVGDNFKSTTAPLNSDASRWQGLITTNSAALSRWVDGAIAELQTLKGVIESGDEDKIEDALMKVRESELKLLTSGNDDNDTNPLEEVGKDRFRQIFFGGLGSKKKDK